MGINRLTTAMLRHDTHHGENLRFQYQRWENTWSYGKMVWSWQQYCDIHSKGSNATLSTTPVGDVQGTKGMVWGSCTAVNQYRLQSTGRGSRLDIWADSSARTRICTTYISSNILGFPMLTEWPTRIRYLWFGMIVSVSFLHFMNCITHQNLVKQPNRLIQKQDGGSNMYRIMRAF